MKHNADFFFRFSDFTLSENLYPPKEHSSFYYIIRGVYYFARGFAYSMIHGNYKYKDIDSLKGKVLFFCLSLNNRRALGSVMSQFDKQEYHLLYDMTVPELTLKRVYIKSLIYVMPILIRFLKYRGNEKRIYGYGLPLILRNPGYFFTIGDFIEKMSPKCVFFSNDHVDCARMALWHCNRLNVRSLYIQHASVANYYPALRFSYSFLDGVESYYKYTDINKNGTSKVVILGACRFDYMKAKVLSSKEAFRDTIGVAVNMIDDYSHIEALCRLIFDINPAYKIIIRTHPAMLHFEHFKWENASIEYTSAHDESPFDFLNRIGILIANDSSIHLDALMARVPSIMYSLSKNGFSDQYSYVSQGLVKYARDENELKHILSSRSYEMASTDIAQFFNAAYGKEYEGNCSAIVANFLKKDFDEKYLQSLGLDIKLAKLV